MALLFRLIEVDYVASAGATVSLLADLPATTLGVRETGALPATAARRVVKLTLAGTTRARLWAVKVTSPGPVELYGMRAWVRQIGRTPSDWHWMTIPVTPTSDGFLELRLPIAPTSDQYIESRLPIAPTSDSYIEARLPIAPTSDAYVESQLPIEPSPQGEQWVSLAEDA